MEQKSLDIFIADNYERYELARKTFERPFDWLKGILKNMTGYDFPSGYALISRQNTIRNIWAGPVNEYPLALEVDFITSCIYIDNYEGPERAIYGWKNLNQYQVEKTFNIKFDENKINTLGGFPLNLSLSS
jgi:hypothetical protein